jgi:hypothetical protein
MTPTPASTELRRLDPASLTFTRHGVDLRLTIAGECCFPRVVVTRAFPLSDPTHWLSVRSAKDEVGVIEDAAMLDDESRRVVLDALDHRYLMPRIRRIFAVKERFGTLEWDVETDRGRRQFTTRALRENATSPSTGRHLISDVDGNRFDVHQVTALDVVSRALLLRHL